MNGAAAPVVLVLARSETFGLRLRMMLEEEGAHLASGLSGEAVDLVITDGGPGVEGVPTLAVESASAGDWETVRRRLSRVLRAGGDEAMWLAAALAQARILVVDDSQTYREYLRGELSRLGASVSVCGSAPEALAALAANSWDCLILDLILPGSDGPQLYSQLARLRRRQKGDYLLVAMSSREGKDDLIRSLNAGADAFIGKSQDMALIAARLGAALRHRGLIRREAANTGT